MSQTDIYGDYDDEEELKDSSHHQESEVHQSTGKTRLIITATILFVIAFVARMVFLYGYADPENPGAGWFGDSYHHWQIAYLTKEIGLGESFLRLWDLKGMEYFWGALHPLVLVIVFMITGNTSMGLSRAVTCFAGAVSVVLIYLICRKYWNEKTAIGAALFTSLCSVIIFNDATGMIEPLGIPFLLAGVYLWPHYSFAAGISFALALMTRSEYWMYAAGMVGAFCVLDRRVSVNKKALLCVGFILLTAIYMKYLDVYTYNPLYPFAQNVDKNIAGEWQYKEELAPNDLFGQFLFRVILGITAIFTAIVLWFKPRGWQLYILGLGNWLFLGLTFGVSEYIKSWADYVWVVRFMLFPYTFLGIVLAVFLFYYLPKFLRILDMALVNWVILFGVIGLTQFAWYEIWKYYEPTYATWSQVKNISAKIAEDYRGGGVLMPEGNPDITYALVQYHGFRGRDMTSQMWDPYYYWEFPADGTAPVNPYEDWESSREKLFSYFKENNIEFLIMYSNRDRYVDLIKREPQYFEKIKDIPNANISTYKVFSKEMP